MTTYHLLCRLLIHGGAHGPATHHGRWDSDNAWLSGCIVVLLLVVAAHNVQEFDNQTEGVPHPTVHPLRLAHPVS